MHNLLILFNPYYQSDVIEQHLKVLKENEKVAFGKVRSKLKTIEHSFETQLEEIYKSVDEENYLQLFLTDFASIYVAKVVKVTNDDLSEMAPSYYKEKGFEVEEWFVIRDIRELINNDFESVRDEILSNFRVPNYDNHTFAIYGNSYVYPLIVKMKEEIDYFESEEENYRYYKNIYKSKRYLDIKENLIKYVFGNSYSHHLHPNTLDNIISAEMEYEDNKNNPIYDFSSIIVKYSKTMEQEIYLFAKSLFKFLMEKEKELENIKYKVQGLDFKLKDILSRKPNLATYKYLITKTPPISDAIEKHLEHKLKYFVTSSFIYYINYIQKIRNASIHEKAPELKDVRRLRAKIIGVATESMLMQIVKNRLIFKYNKEKLEIMKDMV